MFQRGLPIKEAINIGDVAIAPVIKHFFDLDPTQMVKHGDKLEPRPIEIGHKDGIIERLVKIQRGTPDRRLRFYSFITEDDKTRRVSEYTGRYVEYDGKKYKIPE